MNNIIGKKMK